MIDTSDTKIETGNDEITTCNVDQTTDHNEIIPANDSLDSEKIINFELDEDGDVVMDDSDSLLYENRINSELNNISKETVHQSGYNQRGKRSNWRIKFL